MGKFDKKEKCEYCEDEMQSKNRNKRFCSDRCRVYFNRETKKDTLDKNKDDGFVGKNIEDVNERLDYLRKIKNK